MTSRTRQRQGSAARRALLTPKPLARAILCALGMTVLPPFTPGARAEPALPLPDPAAVFATLGAATYSVDGTRAVINQASDRAVLNWKSFDVGSGHGVEFRQPSSTSVALNRISATGRPSEILGELTANGQVYLYNANGVVFGANARVDTNGLVASTLNVSDEYIEQGITRAIEDRNPAFTGNGELFVRDGNGELVLGTDGQPKRVQILVERGAQLRTRDANGRILVIAPQVVNAGNIDANSGQVLLVAATDEVYLQQANADATGVRGLKVEVKTGGEVSNLGTILTRQGNTTLAGFAVNQEGRISATTAISLNGSVRLQATEGATLVPRTDGVDAFATTTARSTAGADGLGTTARVRLGVDSRTEVLPEATTETAVDEQEQPASRVDVIARQITLEKGSAIVAPSGDVTLTATASPRDLTLETASSTDAVIRIAEDSRIDVSGLDAVAAMERNVVEVQLQSNELRDAPIQKQGFLFGKKVRVDVREGTALADISGAAARVTRGIDERSTSGGTLSLRAAGAIELEGGALLDVSGGEVSYSAGYLDTTQLIAEDGRIVDIGQADPNTRYVGILGSVTRDYLKWGVSKTWNTGGPLARGRFEAGYVEGKAGGTLRLKAPQLRLDGELRGLVTSGLRQRTPEDQAKGSRLEINTGFFSDRSQAVVIADDVVLDAVRDALRFSGARVQQSGFSDLDISTQASFTVAADTTLRLDPASELHVTAASIDWSGGLDSAGGKVHLETLAGDLSLGSQARFELQGNWVNDGLGDATTAVVIDGGEVDLQARNGNLSLAAGSRIDVSGGAWVSRDPFDSSFNTEAGRGGSIKLRANRESGAARVQLDGTLTAHALEHGGSLDIIANRIDITADPGGVPAGSLVLAPTFFSQGGFEDYHLHADRDGLTLHSDAALLPRQDNYLLAAGALTNVASARGLAAVASLVRLPDSERAPTDIHLEVSQTGAGANPLAALVLEAGSRIETDPLASLLLTSDTDIFINGSLSAPGGEIDAHIKPPPVEDVFGVEREDPPFRASQGLWVGSEATLSTAGLALFRPDPLNPRAGETIPGGHLALRADRGYLVLAPGSRLDASGGSGVFAEATAGPGGFGITLTDQRLGARGGFIELLAAEGIQALGSLSSRAGAGIGGAGGRLAITLTTERRVVDPLRLATYPANPRVIALGATPGPTPAYSQGAAVPLDGNGLAELSASTLGAGGFGAIDLRADDTIALTSALQLRAGRRITLDAAVIDHRGGSGQVLFTAPYVQIGSSLRREVAQASTPVAGSGRLEVRSNLIDIYGGVSLSGLAQTTLQSQGDIRLRGISLGSSSLTGELEASGNLSLAAAQIYPTTFSKFDITLLDSPGATLDISTTGAASPVYSAGGALKLEAPRILQSGVLKAPFGSLVLEASEQLVLAAGSRTSVSAEGLTIPYGRTLGGIEWVIPVATNQPIQSAPPAKSIELGAPALAVEPGAVVDLSGGGELQAYEFVRGPGGSVDVLDPTDTGYTEDAPYVPKFAILPSLGQRYAPWDDFEYFASGLSVGDSIYLDGGSGVPAGTYALLPAHYALLPGAFLVTPVAQKTTAGSVPDSVSRDAIGQPVVSGYRMVVDTPARDIRRSQFVVEPGDIARTRSEFTVSVASQFYSARAAARDLSVPALPEDAGTLTLAATGSLSLRGLVLTGRGPGGREGRLDISAANIALVNRRSSTPQAGRIELVADELASLGVGSVFIGGRRGSSAGGSTLLSVSADDLTVEGDVSLELGELLLAARSRLAIESGASLSSDETPSIVESSFTVADDVALVRLGPNADARLSLTGTQARTAELRIEADSRLRTPGSLLLHSTGDATVDGRLEVTGGGLTIGAGTIVLGDPTGAVQGVVLRDTQLNQLGARRITLQSQQLIQSYGALALDVAKLTLRAPGIQANGPGHRRLSAGLLVLESGSTTAAPTLASGPATLEFSADSIELGSGSFSLGGFDTTGLEARQGLKLTGNGSFNTAGELNLAAATLRAASGAVYRIEAGTTGQAEDINWSRIGNATAAPDLAAGGRLTLVGRDLDFKGQVELPSGAFELDATGAINLGAAAVVDLAGRTRRVNNQIISTSGGLLRLKTSGGSVTSASGSRIALDAPAEAGDAGSLDIQASGGTMDLAGSISATAATGYRGGQVSVDLGQASAATLDALFSRFAEAGMTELQQLRLRSGDLSLGAGRELRARQVSLSADAGKVLLSGRVVASGNEGGRVEIAGRTGVQLGSTARIEATASADNARGGLVLLAADPLATGASQGVQLDSGSVINVRGGRAIELRTTSTSGTFIDGIDRPTVTDTSGNTFMTGQIQLRAGRTANGLAVTSAGSLAGAAVVEAEAVRVYDLAAGTSINAALIEQWRSDTSNYMATAVALAGLRLTPGIEVRSSGDLSLNAAFNLVDWRYGSTPGALTLRAAGGLTLNASLSDGFRAETIQVANGVGGFVARTLNNAIQPGESWRYRLVAGADLTSSNTLAIQQNGSQDLLLQNGAFVRTGSGSIELAAADDIRLADDRSAVYTVGRRLPNNTELGINNPYGTLGNVIAQFYAEYPIDGGDVRLRAGGDIIGATESTSSYQVGTRTVTATTHQFITDWLAKAGAGVGYSAWGLALDLPTQVLTQTSNGAQIQNLLNARSGFRQNVGALAGGRVELTAGGDLQDVSAVVGSTGRPVGARVNPSAPANSAVYASRDVWRAGGGSLEASAGGDIKGGLWYVDDGAARLAATGRVSGGSQYDAGPVFALGNAGLKVQAGQGIDIGTVFDPGMLTQVYSTAQSNRSTYNYTYGPQSAVELASLGGNVVLHNDVDGLARQAVRYVARQSGSVLVSEATPYLSFTDFLRVQPPQLTAQALGGDLRIERSFSLYPSPAGQLALHAEGDITTLETGNAVIVNLMDVDPTRLPNRLTPVSTFAADAVGVLEVFNRNGLSHAATPLHANGGDPVRISTRLGDIRARDRLLFVSAKRAEIAAGRDIVNIDLDLQHAVASDRSSISAGRDIRFDTEFNQDTGALVSLNQEILLGGGGRYVFTAGRNIDLGASNGIASVGNTRNPALPSAGASLGVYAGFSPNADWAGFGRYLLANRESGLLDPALASALEVAVSQGAVTPAMQDTLTTRFFDVIRESGLEGIAEKGFGRGEAAIAALFPGSARRGDLRLYFSKITTLTGGGIDLLVPGGLINAGLAASVLNAKPASELGIVVQRAGEVNVYVQGDLQVNASRVFALGGGDITVWSNEGDIDAGRGAKSALSVPPPTVTFDANGNLRVEFPAVISGSGIRTASSGFSQTAGDVFLFAPKGVINAGEAGIGGDNIFIFGEACLNCGNIDVGGTAIGIPTTPNVAVPAGLAGAGDAAANAAQSAGTKGTDSAAGGAGADKAPVTRPLLVVADLVGFGDYSLTDVRSGRHEATSTAPERRRE